MISSKPKNITPGRRRLTPIERLESRTLLAAQIYLTNVQLNTVGEYSSSGTLVNAALIAGGGTTYQNVTVSGSNVFVTNYFAGTIGEYTTSGATINASLVTGISGGIGPFAVAVSGSQLFVAIGDGGAPGTAGKINEYTLGATPGTIASSNTNFITGLADPGSIVVSGSDLFITDYANGVVGEYATSGAVVNASLVSGLVQPQAVVVDGSNLFVTSATNKLGEYTTSGSPVNPSLIPGLNGPIGLAVSGSDLFVVNSGNGTVGEYTTSGTLVNASLISGLSNTLNIAVTNSPPAPPPPGQLAFSGQPVGTTAAGTLSPITVDVDDSTGTLLASDNSNVSIAIGIGPSGSTLGGTTTVAAVSGVATFSNLSLSTVGNYALTATDSSDTAATSKTFPITSTTPVETIGGLDPTFGVGGLAGHDVGFSNTAGVIVQPNGQSIIVGTLGTVPGESFGVTRYNVDGSLDTSFGTGGVASAGFGDTDDVPTAVNVLPGGQILVAGTVTTFDSSGDPSGREFGLAMLNSDGSVDTNFGDGTGEVLVSFSSIAGTLSNDVLQAIAVNPGGTIYLGGQSNANGTSGEDFALAALNPDGTLDASFGTGGKILKDFAGGDDVINSLALQTNGDLVAAGSATVGGVVQVALARFLPNGALDSHFGAKGLVTTNVRGVFDSASSVVIQPKGQIVIGGLSTTGSGSSLNTDFLVARYTAAGALDRTFGSGGTVITNFGQPSAVTQVVLQADGEIVASGKTTGTLSSVDPSHLGVAVARYTTRGILDTTFNGIGTAVIGLGDPIASPFVSHVAAFSQVTIAPLDATGLGSEFAKFEQSATGVLAVTQGGELLDVGNSGTDTTEAKIVTAGVDLAAALISTLPAAALEGAKGMIMVKVTESGAVTANGTVTLQLYASLDGQIDNGLAPFQSMTARVNLKPSQSRTFPLRYTLPANEGAYYVLANIDTGSLHSLNSTSIPAISPSAVQVAAPFVHLAAANLISINTPAAGKLATISFSVTNDGNILARSAPVQILASPDGTVASGTQIAEPKLLFNLLPGTTRTYRLSLKIPSTLAAGTYLLVAVLDPSDTLNDPNLANNVIVGSTQFMIP